MRGLVRVMNNQVDSETGVRLEAKDNIVQWWLAELPWSHLGFNRTKVLVSGNVRKTLRDVRSAIALLSKRLRGVKMVKRRTPLHRLNWRQTFAM